MPLQWADLQIDQDALLELCRAEDLSAGASIAFLDRRRRRRGRHGCASSFRRRAHAGRRRTAARRRDPAALDALTREGVTPILIKGTPLAYTVYNAPALRPREDTDLLISPADVDIARRVLSSLRYSATVYADDLFSQFEMQKVDRFGVCHVFDVHWKISTQAVFDRVLTYDEHAAAGSAGARAGPARDGGRIGRRPAARVHPSGDAPPQRTRALWIYDLHLLAGRLSTHQFAEFTLLARQKQVAGICAHQLRAAQSVFRTALPAGLIPDLSRPGDPEPSAAYLASHRRWHHELASSIRGLPRFGDRIKLLRDVLLPSPGYMLSAYGLRGKPLAPWLLPALYVHRNVRGAWKILTGKK